MEDLVQQIKKSLLGHFYPLQDEIQTHEKMHAVMVAAGLPFFEREFKLNKKDRIDFYFPESGLGVEVKVQGSPNEILKQLERYALNEQIKALLYVSGYFIGLPPEVNGKPLYSVHLSRGML